MAAGFTHVFCGAGGRQGEFLVQALLADDALLEAATRPGTAYCGTSMGSIIVRALASEDARGALAALAEMMSGASWRDAMLACCVRAEVASSMLLGTHAVLEAAWLPVSEVFDDHPVRKDGASVSAMVWHDGLRRTVCENVLDSNPSDKSHVSHCLDSCAIPCIIRATRAGVSDGAHETAFARAQVRAALAGAGNRVLVLSCFPWPLKDADPDYFAARLNRTCEWSWRDRSEYAHEYMARDDMLLSLAKWGVYKPELDDDAQLAWTADAPSWWAQRGAPAGNERRRWWGDAAFVSPTKWLGLTIADFSRTPAAPTSATPSEHFKAALAAGTRPAARSAGAWRVQF